MAVIPASTLIVPMTSADIDGVMAIERLAFRTPWSAQVFLDELGRTHAHVDVLWRLPDRRLVGFVNYWLVADEVHVLNVAIHPELRRQGLARRLMDHVLAFAQDKACRLLTLEVRRSNAAAQALYGALGFRQIGIRTHYYADDGEDAIVMVKDLLPRPSLP